MESYPVEGHIIGVEPGYTSHKIYLDGKEVSSQPAWSGESHHLIEFGSDKAALQINIKPHWHYCSTSTEIIKNGIVIFSNEKRRNKKESNLGQLLISIALITLMAATTPTRYKHEIEIERVYSEQHQVLSIFGADQITSSLVSYSNYVLFSTTQYQSHVVSIGFMGAVWVINADLLR